MKFERIENSRVKAEFTVTRADFTAALDKSFEVNNEKVTIKGFRKGKASKATYLKNFGVESLYAEAIDIVANNIISNEIVKSTEFRIVNSPDLDFDVEKLSTEEDFNMTMTFDVHPTFTLGKYKGIEVKKEAVKVTDEDVKTEINNQLKSKVELNVKKKQVIASGDVAIFDFCGSVDGVEFDGGKAENYELKIGSGQFIPGFEDQMIGMKGNEEKDVVVTFPEEYMEKSLAGKEAVFKVKVHEVKEEVYPTLSDELVKEFNIENVNTVSEYNTHVTAKLEESKTTAAEQTQENALFKSLIDGTQIDLPKSYIDNRVKELVKNVEDQAQRYNIPLDMFLQFSGLTLEQFKAQSQERAVNDIKLDCILAEIVKAEKFESTDAELDAFITDEATKYNSTKEVFEKQYGRDIFKYNFNLNKALDLVKTSKKVK